MCFKEDVIRASSFYFTFLIKVEPFYILIDNSVLLSFILRRMFILRRNFKSMFLSFILAISIIPRMTLPVLATDNGNLTIASTVIDEKDGVDYIHTTVADDYKNNIVDFEVTNIPESITEGETINPVITVTDLDTDHITVYRSIDGETYEHIDTFISDDESYIINDKIESLSNGTHIILYSVTDSGFVNDKEYSILVNPVGIENTPPEVVINDNDILLLSTPIKMGLISLFLITLAGTAITLLKRRRK